MFILFFDRQQLEEKRRQCMLYEQELKLKEEEVAKKKSEMESMSITVNDSKMKIAELERLLEQERAALCELQNNQEKLAQMNKQLKNVCVVFTLLLWERLSLVVRHCAPSRVGLSHNCRG